MPTRGTGNPGARERGGAPGIDLQSAASGLATRFAFSVCVAIGTTYAEHG